MKEYNGPLILCAALLLGALLIAPAFAEMKKVDDSEMAKTNASVTGASVKDQNVGVEKYLVNPQLLPDSESFNKNADSSPTMSASSAATFLDMNINGQTTFTFGFGGSTYSEEGSITSVKMH